jgi:hypothetical protein
MMKKTTVIQIIFFTIFILTACQKQERDNSIHGLEGTWIETTTRTDTIVFTTNSTTGLLTLNRGLQKTGSGPYTYEISKDSIELKWLLSNSVYSDRYNYFFKLNEISGTFNIQAFTTFDTNKAILTFQKL